MRAVWTIAFVLAVTGHTQAQENNTPRANAEASEASAEVHADVVAATSEEIAEPEVLEAVVADVPEAQVPTEVDVVEPAVVGIQEVEPSRIERIESTVSPMDDDDLPPSLRARVEEPPRGLGEAQQVHLSPWKGYFGFSSGLALHLNARDEFQQGVVAPAYLHLRGGAVLPGRGTLRHAVQLGVSTNLSREGAYPSGTLALRQWVIVPSYVLRIGLDSTPLPAWVVTARVGIPIVVSPDVTAGAELAFGAQFFARAGIAIFAEAIYDVFVGGRVRDGSRSTHHLLALEVGLQFELEVLP
ncbi:MAG: hypothetical protein ACI9KE_006519 [Polyangiales bacterium]